MCFDCVCLLLVVVCTNLNPVTFRLVCVYGVYSSECAHSNESS